METRETAEKLSLRRVLRFTVAERPVLFRDFHQIDQDIFFAQACFLIEQVGDPAIKHFLHFRGAAGVQRDLDDDEIVRAGNIRIPGA
jgi:hypothetical protein